MFIALMGFLVSILFNRKTDAHGLLRHAEDKVDHQLRLIEKLEKDLTYCRGRVQDLLDENMILLRKVAGIKDQKLMSDDIKS